MFKKVLEETYSFNTIDETYAAFLLAKANCEEEVLELGLIMDKILYGDMGLTDIYAKINSKTKRLIDLVIENRNMLTKVQSSEFYLWLRNFNNDEIKYVLCAKALANIGEANNEEEKSNLFKLICAINMDRKHKIFDALCDEAEKIYGSIPIKYFLTDIDMQRIYESYSLQKAMDKQKEVNKVHCGIIRLLDYKETNFVDLDREIKEIFDKFSNIKTRLEYDKDSIDTILSIFYLLEEYFMFKWEYIKEQGLEGFIEKYIYFDK